MIHKIRNKFDTVTILIIIYGLQGLAANLAHPITPSFLKSMNFPSSMFGIIFAAMALTNFAFSPFWGVMSKYLHSKTLLFIGAIGYGVGQAIFGFSSSPVIIIFARLVSGAFVSAIFVGTGLYVVENSKPHEQSQNITKMITVFSVSGTIGYFLGGYIGGYSLVVPFIVQVITLFIVGTLFYFLLNKNEVAKEMDYKRILRASNPMVKSEIPLTLNFKIIFLVVFIISTASTSLTQTFSYYIVDSLQMTSFANGLSKGLVGFISLIFNFTITLKIVNSKHVERNIMFLFMFMALVLMPMIGFGSSALVFIVLGIIAMSIDTMPVSLLQGRTMLYSTPEIKGEMLGFHNASKSLGMIVGSLIAGTIYDWNALSTFILSLGLYGLGIILMVLFNKYVK